MRELDTAAVSSELTATREAWVAASARAIAAERMNARLLARLERVRRRLDGLATAILPVLEAGPGERVVAAADALLRDSRALAKDLGDLVDDAALDAGVWRPRRESFPLGEAVRSALQTAAAAAATKGLRFHIEIDPAAESVIEADARALRGIVTALAGNAVRFTRRGAVSVSAAIEATGEPRIVVSDTGPGMSETARAGLFRVGEQDLHASPSPPRGLLRSWRLAAATGAKLSCESVPGVGTAFILTLPRVPGSAARPKGPAAASCPPAGPVAGSPRSGRRRGASTSLPPRLRSRLQVRTALAGAAT